MTAKKTSVKCAYEQCGLQVKISERVTETIVSKSGKTSYKHFHLDCHSAYLRHQELRKNDAPELASLYETIKRIHNIPNETNVIESIITHIQDVRNGTIRRGKVIVKRYKEGVPFGIIEDAYKIVESKIRYYVNGGKAFKDKKSELKYCFAIVLNNIDLAYHRRKKAEKDAELRDEVLHKDGTIGTQAPVTTSTTTFKRSQQKTKYDISALLD